MTGMRSAAGRGARIVVLLPLLAAAVVVASPARAASPATGTITSAAPLDWDFAPVQAVNSPVGDPTGLVGRCTVPGECDSFALAVQLPQSPELLYQQFDAALTIDYTWSAATPTDLDIWADGPGKTDHFGPGSPDQTAAGAGEEVLTISDPDPGAWTITSAAYTAAQPTAAHAHAVLTLTPRIPLGGPPSVPLTPVGPRLMNYLASTDLYQVPVGLVSGNTAACTDPAPSGSVTYTGEPSLGVDWNTGKVMYIAGCSILRVTFNDGATPAAATWENVSSPFTSTYSNDPILWVDSTTGRTFVSQLANPAPCNFNAVSDDDGATWTPAQGCGLPSGDDHQTVGGGPYASPLDALNGNALYPHIIYVCSQTAEENATAWCATSVDGGMTFGAASPLFDKARSDCISIHGHVKVGPDGTAYVPNGVCGNEQGFAVTADNGLTWTTSHVPGTVATVAVSDPSIGIDAGNTVYFGANSGGHPVIAWSHDHGQTWSKPVDVGAGLGIRNTVFPEVVGGDAGRAAFAFLGTTTAGDYQAARFGCDWAAPDAQPKTVNCPGAIWHLYVAYTYDGGGTWTLVDATPDHPVQRGCVWQRGGSNECRNMLDFNDAQLDKQGRVLVAYTQGCTGPCLSSTLMSDRSYSRVAAIARQSCGKGLFAAYDATSTPCSGPMLPTVVTVSAGQVHGAQAAQVLPNTSGSGGVPYAVLLWLGALALPGVLLTARRAHTGARI